MMQFYLKSLLQQIATFFTAFHFSELKVLIDYKSNLLL